MGPEIWVPLLLSTVGTGAQVYNTNKTARKQDNRLAAQLRDQASKQRKADAKTSELIQKTAKSDATDEKAQSLGDFLQRLKMAQGNANRPMQQVGAVSDEYRQDAQEAALGASNYGQRIAGLLSSIDAPGQQRVNEATDALRFGQEIDQIKRFSAGDDFLHQMKLRGIRRNPWLDAAGGIAKGAANADYSEFGWGGI